MSEPSVLMVPVHIDALVLRQDRAVVDALADFTRLPYSDGQARCQLRHRLPQRGHPHRSFRQSEPAAAGRGAPALGSAGCLDQGGRGRRGHGFPVVPNRWLGVARAVGPGGLRHRLGGGERLPASRRRGRRDGQRHLSRRPPWLGGAAKPFRYLGRVVPLAAWTADAAPGAGADRSGLRGADLRRLLPQLPQRVRPVRRRSVDLHGRPPRHALRRRRLVLRRRPGLPDGPAALRAVGRSGAGDAGGGPLGGDPARRRRVPDPDALLRPPHLRPVGRTHQRAARRGAGHGRGGELRPQVLCAYLGDAVGGTDQLTAEEQLEAVLLAPRSSRASSTSAPGSRRPCTSPASSRARPALWTLRQESSVGAADAVQAGRRSAMSAALPAELTPDLDRLAARPERTQRGPAGLRPGHGRDRRARRPVVRRLVPLHDLRIPARGHRGGLPGHRRGQTVHRASRALRAPDARVRHGLVENVPDSAAALSRRRPWTPTRMALPQRWRWPRVRFERRWRSSTGARVLRTPGSSTASSRSRLPGSGSLPSPPCCLPALRCRPRCATARTGACAATACSTATR